MRIQSIELQNFMVHDSMALNLPPAGIVTITGPIGSGKSSFPEGVAAVWNQSIRNTKSRRTRGFRRRMTGSVTIVRDDGLEIERTQARSGTLGLSYTVPGGSRSTFTTPTKTQENLETHIGSYDRWRRSCLFSSGNASAFSDALDSERREILEELLDLSLYVRAHEVAKGRRTKLSSELDALRVALTDNASHLHQARESLDRATQTFAGLQAPEPLPESESVADMKGREAELQERVDRASLAVNWERNRVEVAASVRIARERVEHLAKSEEHVEIPDEVVIDQLRAKWHALAGEIAEMIQSIGEYDETAVGLREKLAGYTERMIAAQKEFQRLDRDQCPTCLQDISPPLKAKATKALAETNSEVAQARKTIGATLAAVGEELTDVRAELATLRTEQAAAKERGTELKIARVAALRRISDAEATRVYAAGELERAEKREAQLGSSPGVSESYDDVSGRLTTVREARILRERVETVYTTEIENHRGEVKRWTAEVDRQGAAVLKAEKTVTGLRARVELTQTDLAVAEEGVKVLGPKGARSAFLTQAIEAIELVANSWLELFHRTLRVKLSAYSETVQGTVKMEIKLEALGLAEGEDYLDLSNGERRCMDFALVLSLSDVYRKAQGITELGSLWLDEILDALCPDTSARVCAAVNEMAKTRSIVVISHKALILDQLKAVKNVKFGEAA